MTLMPILAAATEAAGENPFAEVARQFGWEPRMFFSQVVLFIMVAAILTKFAYKPLLAMLDQRKKQIAESLENAEKTRQELAAAEATRQEILRKTNAEAGKLLEEARATADKVREVETQKAIAAAEQIIAKAREAAQQDHARMLAELKKEVGRLVVQTTVTVTGKVLSSEDQKRLAEETAQQISA